MKHSITWEERRKARERLESETGAIIKDWGGKLPFAFVYPNTYFIGMSNLGLQAIYSLLNSREDTVCERAFWDQSNRQEYLLPVSVESQRPLTDFAILAFSLNYEIDYFNIPPILKTSGIPLYSAERDETHPLIIAGGPCITANPLPVAPFFDCLCIGEAEALLPPMVRVLSEGIAGRRDQMLDALSRLPGVWVPRVNRSSVVARQWLKNLDDYPVHSSVLTQDTELNDLYLLEVQRGCAHGCRFCLVDNAFKPVRFHSLESLVRQAETGLKYRRRIGLVGPAVTDHPQIEQLLAHILQAGGQVSISSLRITSLNQRIMAQMVSGGLHSIALAPESGSECLRRSIHKGIDEGQVMEAIQMAAAVGMQQVKLYFMLGLPGETDPDIQAIVDLTLAGKSVIDHTQAKTRLSINLSPFVPKAGTPFERMPMAPIETLRQKTRFLKNKLTPLGVKINSESPPWSEIQAVLARGDSRLAAVLADIAIPSLPEWRQAVEKHAINVDYIAHQPWDQDIKLPWDLIKI